MSRKPIMKDFTIKLTSEQQAKLRGLEGHKDYLPKQEQPFTLISWETVEPSEGESFVRCVVKRGTYQGNISFITPNMDKAEELLKKEGGALADAFDQLTLKPAKAPNMDARDWQFEYDSTSSEPIYKYTVVHGTLADKSGKPFGFGMSKMY